MCTIYSCFSLSDVFIYLSHASCEFNSSCGKGILIMMIFCNEMGNLENLWNSNNKEQTRCGWRRKYIQLNCWQTWWNVQDISTGVRKTEMHQIVLVPNCSTRYNGGWKQSIVPALHVSLNFELSPAFSFQTRSLSFYFLQALYFFCIVCS